MRTFKLVIAIAVLTSGMAQAQMLCGPGDTDCLRSRDYSYGGAQNQEDYEAAQRWQQQNNSYYGNRPPPSNYASPQDDPYARYQQSVQDSYRSQACSISGENCD